MDKKTIIIPIAMLSLVFLFIFVHELGHYVVAKQYDFNPSMHFFSTSEDTKNNSFFTQGFAHVSYSYVYYKKISPENQTVKVLSNGQDIDIINRKILFAGLWFEMILLAIISGIAMIITLKREDWLLFVLTSVMFAITLSAVFEWNLFNPIYASDLYYIIMGC